MSRSSTPELRSTGSRFFRWVAAGLAACCLPVLAGASPAVVEETRIATVETAHGPVHIVQVLAGLEHPWAMAWLPDGRMLVTERAGRMLLVDGEEVTALGGLPAIDSEQDQRSAPDGGSQGGLFDVVVHPDHARTGWIYFTLSSPGDDDGVVGDADRATGTALVRARLEATGNRLEDVETLYVAAPRRDPGRHYGGRIVFPGDGTVLLTIGDRGLRHPSQDLTDPAGSIVRLDEDGGAADGNPFIGMAPGNLRPEIYSYGHRNNQGLAIDPRNGDIWTTEHGPAGGDLLHRVVAGANYGWPQVAYGAEYSTGERVGIGRGAPGIVPPVHVWRESKAPSGLAFYSGDAMPEWKGDLFAGFLLSEELYRLVVEEGLVVDEERVLDGTVGRIRDVRQGPDGLLYVATDHGDGGIYRLEPGT